MILQAWLTLPSCLASSSRPTLARITLRSVVILRLLGKEGYREWSRPSGAPGSYTIQAGLSDQILANTDLLKLIVSTEQFDAILFDQEKLDRYATTRGTTKSVPRSALERLAARVHVRGLATMPATEDSIADWSTGQLALTVVRPLEAVEVPPSGKV